MPRRRSVTPAMRAALGVAALPVAAPLAPSAPQAPAEFKPLAMTPALAKEVERAGYRLPESWPANARVILDANSRNGWTLAQPGSLNPEHPNFCGKDQYFPEPVLTAPDGTRFVKAANGARVVLVTLSKVTGPKFLRVAPGARRPKWVIEMMPKGEIPEHLRAYLLGKGEKLVKGESRKARAAVAKAAEAFAVEPEMVAKAQARGKHGVGIRGVAAQFIGPRPRTGAKSPELREWERSFRKLQKERPEIFAALKAAK